MNVTITVDYDKKCKVCGKPGAMQPSGICMKCLSKTIRSGELDHIVKPKIANA